MESSGSFGRPLFNPQNLALTNLTSFCKKQHAYSGKMWTNTQNTTLTLKINTSDEDETKAN